MGWLLFPSKNQPLPSTDLPKLFSKKFQYLSQPHTQFLPLKGKDLSFKSKLQITNKFFILTSSTAKKKAQQRQKTQPLLQIPSKVAKPDQWAGTHLEKENNEFRAGTQHSSCMNPMPYVKTQNFMRTFWFSSISIMLVNDFSLVLNNKHSMQIFMSYLTQNPHVNAADHVTYTIWNSEAGMSCQPCSKLLVCGIKFI